MKKDNLKKAASEVFLAGFNASLESIRQLFVVEAQIEKIRIRPGETIRQELTEFLKGGNHLIVKTEIIGDLAGASYLLFDKDEVEHSLLRHCEDKGVVTPYDFLDFVKEVDNILSANVITALSNALEVNIYGDAPHFVDKATMIHCPKAKNDKKENTALEELSIITRYAITSPIKCHLDFLWELKEDFNEKLIEKLNMIHND